MSKGSIIKREGKDGAVSWLLKYDADRDAKGARQQRYKTIRGGTKKEAQAELRRLLSEVDKGTHVDPSKLTFGQWAEKWLAELATMGDVSARTLEGYAGWLNVHVLPTLGSVQLQKLKATQLRELYVQLRTDGHKGSRKEEAAEEVKGLSAQSVLHIHRVISNCLRAAVEADLIAVNPAAKAKAPAPKRSRASSDEDGTATIKALDPDQLPALLAAFRGKDIYPVVVVALATGLRRGEILGLRWSSVDIERKTLQVSQTVEQTRAYGVRIKPDAKNRSSLRTISISPELCDVLKAHRIEQKAMALKLGVSYPADCLMFPTVIQRPRGKQPAGGLPVHEVDFSRPGSPEAITKEFGRIASAAGFTGFRFHDCRHTHATQLLTAGIPLHAVAQRLGHSTPAVTMQTYAHVLKRSEDQAAQVSGDLMRNALQG